MRLAKFLQQAGIASRRVCEDIIARGSVTVNGSRINEVVTMVDPDRDEIIVNGQQLNIDQRKTIWLHYKQRGELVSETDPAGRRHVSEMV
jgi:23S rRNA pseudouridine2605 synthase